MENLNLSRAVKEIIEAILNISPSAIEGDLHLQIKSSKKNISSRSDAWYYIKVATSAIIRKETFSGLPVNSSLYEVLRSMHTVENESHLCLQCPTSDECVQYYLILNGQTLEIQHETTKTKQTNMSVLYLRLHQQFMHVLDQSKLIQNYLMLLKVFRPQWNFNFNIKIGDVTSRDRFRADDWNIVSDFLPPFVTDPYFFLSKSEITPVGACTATSISLPYLEDTLGQLHMSVLGCVIPISRKQTTTCALLVNIYGPNFVPMDSQGAKIAQLMEKVNWSHAGLILSSSACDHDVQFPCHGKVILEPERINSIDPCVIFTCLVLHPSDDHKDTALTCHYNMDSILLHHQQTCIQGIERFIQKALQPVQDKAKLRGITQKSILSVCKAVTDIVTLSDNEDFRKKMFTCMQVDDKVDLGNKLESKLLSISKRRHHGVWTGWENTDTILDLQKESINHHFRQSHEDDKSNCELEQSIFQEPKIPQEVASAACRRKEFTEERPEEKTADTSVTKSPFYELAESDTSDADQRQVDDSDRTPEIINLTEKMQEVSPFHELAAAEFVDPHVRESLIEDPHQSVCPTAKGDGDFHTKTIPTTNSGLNLVKNCTGDNEDFDSLSRLQVDLVPNFKNISEITNTRFSTKTEPKLQDLSDFELMKHEDFPATLQIVSDFVDKTASELCINQDIAVNQMYAESSSNNMRKENNVQDKDKVSSNIPQKDPDSDDWFDDVLMDVEDWLI